MTTPNTFVNTRLIPAPRDLVFRAITGPDSLARWWGPKGFRNTFHECDPTPGGLWRFDMHGPDGKDYPNECRFEQIEPGKIVVRHVVRPVFLMTMDLEEEDGGTRLTWHQAFDDAAAFEKCQAYVPRCNEENFDRLEAELARLASAEPGGRELFLTRIIDAPPEKVYRAWTDPELLVQWFAPLPYTTPSARLDVRPGGSNRIVMRDPDGNDMPMQGVYLEVVPNERLVTTDAYTSAWTPSEKPFLTLDLTFEAFDGRTRYRARALHWTTGDRDKHAEMGFHDGWGTCAEQLANLIGAPPTL